jgi:transcriptional regulator
VYTPSFNRADAEPSRALLRAHPFMALVTPGPEGLLTTHLPLLLVDDVLHGHMARANPHWRHLDAADSLAICTGPHGYVSPAWYAPGPDVPTWNYTAVHVHGRARLVDDPRPMLRQLVARFDPAWVMDLPPDFEAGLVAGIVAFELPITRLEGKFKLSQNRDAADRAGVVAGLRALGDHVLADLVEQAGQGA